MLDCPISHVGLTATLLPGTLQTVGGTQDKLDLKAVGKLFFLDPLAGLREAVVLARTRTRTSPLTKIALERNALTEFAPEYVRTFVNGLTSGDRLGIALIEHDATTAASIRYVFLGPAAELSNDKRRYCARPKADLFNTLILDGAK